MFYIVKLIFLYLIVLMLNFIVGMVVIGFFSFNWYRIVVFFVVFKLIIKICIFFLLNKCLNNLVRVFFMVYFVDFIVDWFVLLCVKLIMFIKVFSN